MKVQLPAARTVVPFDWLLDTCLRVLLLMQVLDYTHAPVYCLNLYIVGVQVVCVIKEIESIYC